MKTCAHCGRENPEDAAKCCACGTAAFFEPIPPPLTTTPVERRDAGHLELLAVFSFVVGALSICGIGFVFFHHYLVNFAFTNMANARPQSKSVPPPPLPPPELFHLINWLYLGVGTILLAACVLNILSGLFLRRRKHRMFSLVVAGINCVQFPFGTTLGVFTIIILARDSVRQLYDRANPTSAR